MAEIKCPKCGEIIKLDKSEYDSLLSDIKQEEIDKRVEAQEKLIKDKYQAEYDKKLAQAQNAQNTDVQKLEKDLAELRQQLKNKDQEVELAVAKAISEEQKKTSAKQEEIVRLQGEINNAEQKQKLAVAEAIQKEKEESNKKDTRIIELEGKLEVSQQEKALSEKNLKEQYDFQLKAKDDEIKHWKEFRVGDSTKDIGESLEQYCRDQFDTVRADSYPFAYFEKDNIVVEGSKGDFIFRDYSDETKENEIVSIMFEMKNQKEDGDTKNESHFKKLDSDRKKKKCEYAVLVSTLEPDRALYNNGIYDVYPKYEKMFVVRPQFFLAILSLIKKMAKTRFEDRKEVILYQKQNVDITNFENTVRDIAKKINDDYENAGKHYDAVEKMCDSMIDKLKELKEAFRLGKKWIGVAQSRLPELEIRKLTKNNPTMKAKFEALDQEVEEEKPFDPTNADDFLASMEETKEKK